MMCERQSSQEAAFTKAVDYAVPPVGFYRKYGAGVEFGASIPLTLLGWIPGVIYAMVMFDEGVEKSGNELVGEWLYRGSKGTRVSNVDMDEKTGDLCFVSGKLQPDEDMEGNTSSKYCIERQIIAGFSVIGI